MKAAAEFNATVNDPPAAVIDCPACASPGLEPVVDLGRPVVSIVSLAEDPPAAQGAARGPVRLVACPTCALVINADFDPALVRYDSAYENSLHFSPTFQAYAGQLADRLAARYNLRDRHIIELGSGRGDFLGLLCAASAATGTGYDPSYLGAPAASEALTLVPDFYPLAGPSEPFDFLVARHVLEHLTDPFATLSALRAAAGKRPAHIYVEVPNSAFVLTPAGLWDVIYEHVCYFSEASLYHLLRRAGFHVLDVGTAFDGQFLYAEAATEPTDDELSTAPDSVDQLAAIRAFAELYRRTVAGWTDRLAARGAGRTALWGAGAKGATFLNAVAADSIDFVVDLNPRKWDRYVPGTGHSVGPPDRLVDAGVDTVLITNSAYQGEIVAQLDRLGVQADVIAV